MKSKKMADSTFLFSTRYFINKIEQISSVLKTDTLLEVLGDNRVS